MSSLKPWVVLKFGGTSVATVKTWGQILRRVQVLLPTNRVWLVVSALSKVTNALLSALEEATAVPSSSSSSSTTGSDSGATGGAGATTSSSSSSSSSDPRFKSYAWIVSAHERLAADMSLTPAEYAPVQALLDDVKRLLDGIVLTGEVSFKLRARVAAFGELLSSQLGHAFLRRSGLKCNRVDSRTLLTSDVDDSKNLSEADIYLEADVKPSIQADRTNAASGGADVVICQGFIASTPTGATCLLGRGGSDTSGALFAALCDAARCEIWTDVNGMFTADPRGVPRARLIRSLTYREAQELAAMGAKVLHPRCLLPAAFAGIPVEVRNTMDPSDDAEITVVSVDGLEYKRKAAAAAASEAANNNSTNSSSGGASTGGGGGRTPLFTAMPAVRSPSPISSSKIVFSSAVPSTESSSEGVESAAAAASNSIDGGKGDLPDFSLDGGATTTTTTTASSDTETSSTGSSPKSISGGLGIRSPSASGWLTGAGGGGSGNHTPIPSKGLVASAGPAKVLAVARRKGVTLVSMVAYDMWGNAGFLSKVFTPFGVHGVSVDLIATSQYAVSVTLDHIPDGIYGSPFRRVVSALSKVCTVEVRYPCAVVSVVGRSLRNALPALGAAMKALQGVPVHMVSEASEDLNMSFVVDEEHADGLVAALHGELLENDSIEKDFQFGPVWTEMPCGKGPLP